MKGVLFDLDGVLVDTEPTYTRIWSDIDQHFPTGVANFAHVIKGSNLESILNGYFPKEIHPQVVDLLLAHQRQMRYDLFPGAVEVLTTLRKKGIPCALVTSSDQGKMDSFYQQHPDFADFFHTVVTGDMVTHAKPHPECFLLGASRLGLAPQDCYVVEDSINGLKAAHAAGVTVIALATTLTREAIAPYADIIADDISHLARLGLSEFTPID